MRVMIIVTALALCVGACFAAPENLLTNPGFEDDLAGWHHGFEGRTVVSANVVHSGTKAARVSVKGQNGALDHMPLVVGVDLKRDAVYEASAWMRSGGVEQGNFGARVYFFGADEAVVGMTGFGGMGDGTPAGDWKEYKFTFGSGTANPIPEDCTSVKLRFSIWREDGNCIGTVWVDDVSLVEVKASAAQVLPKWMEWSENGTVVVLKDDLPVVEGIASDPDALVAMLEETGMAVNVVSAAQLAEAGVLEPDYVDLVVLPYAEAFPALVSDAFLRYANNGGSFVSLGGLAFDSLCRKVDGEWINLSDSVTTADANVLVSDFEAATPEWDFEHSDAPGSMTVEYVKPGAKGTAAAAKLQVEELTGWSYGGVETQAPDAEYGYLCFWAKGDADTTQLAIELNEDDESRWKYVVPLSDEWEWFELSTREFASYATEGRGGPGDYLHGERVKIALFGFTKGMVGGGTHNLYIDELQWRKPLIENGVRPRPMRRAATSEMVTSAFGSDLVAASGDGVVRPLPIFSPPIEIHGASKMRVNWPPTLAGEELEGDFNGYRATQPSWYEIRPRQGKGESAGLRLGSDRVEREIALLEAFDAEGQSQGPIGMLWIPRNSASNPGIWAYFGISDMDIAEADFFGPMLRQIAYMASGGARLKDAQIIFEAAEDDVIPMLQVEVAGRAAGDGELSVEATVDIAGQSGKAISQPVAAGQILKLSLTELPATARDYEVTVELLADGSAVDEIVLRVDARETLIRVCDWLVNEQGEDGLFGALYFEENRAVRGLLGAWEITGDQRYLDAAIRWGEAQMERQREDGGYRMGYGMGSRGEACYVADGGEIAIAMGRLVSYTSGTQQKRLVASLRKYFAYRESFRQESGAIGVGWCLHDYGKRPIVPLDKPTKIFSGETNQYTIGCSLAAATAYAQITGDPEDMAMVQRDTQWFVDNYTSYSGAAAESAIWAYHYTANDEMKTRLREELDAGFRARLIAPGDTGWLSGAGRSVLDLDFITYWVENMGPDPEMEAALGRWLFALCDPSSPASIVPITERGEITGTERRFICFASVALADAVEPMVSMKSFEKIDEE